MAGHAARGRVHGGEQAIKGGALAEGPRMNRSEGNDSMRPVSLVCSFLGISHGGLLDLDHHRGGAPQSIGQAMHGLPAM